MMSYWEISELIGQDLVKSLGFTEEVFLSLPSHYQQALVSRCLNLNKKRSDKEISNKIMTLRQYTMEENINKKVLSLFKKK